MSQQPTTNSESNQPNPTNSFPNRESSDQANSSTEASSRTPALSPAGGGISHSSHSRVSQTDHDLTTLRADIKSIVINNLLASPFLTRFYVDSIINNFPNSNAAKLLARNYQKIIDRITMANSKSCTHIKVNGVRCESPALRGEQFCYFHQHALRGVRRPSRSRLHPMALIESEEAIQASLMEVINGLLRNTLDARRAELILRALHIAVKNARRTKFEAFDPVREIPEYAEPVTEAVDTDAFGAPLSEIAADPADESLPAVAAVPYAPVDPRDPHWLERFEEGGRGLAREERERRAAEARAAKEGGLKEDSSRIAGRDASTAPRPSLRSDVAPLSMTGEGITRAGNTAVDPARRKPPAGVKAQSKNGAAPKERKNAAQRASAG